jgi:outer membrane protein TolC
MRSKTVLCLVAWLAAASSGWATGEGQAPAGASSPAPGGQGAASAPEVLHLTLADAIARGLEHNLAAVLAHQGVLAASGARELQRSALLPSISAGLLASRQTISLEQYGFPVAPGESPLIGPYNVVMGDLSLSQALLDVSALDRARAGASREEAARFSEQEARDLVVTVCAGAYLQAVAAASRVEAAKAQLTTAQALEARARDMRAAGTVAGIEVLRAGVQLAAQRQRHIQATNDERRATLALAKAIGLPLDQPFELEDKVPYAALEVMSADEALKAAAEGRPDLKSARALLRAAENEREAAVWQGRPSLHFDADVARVGNSMSSLETTYSAAAMLRIPLFEGGRVEGQVSLATAALEQQRARVAELQARVEYEVRMALLDLHAANDQVQVARSARSLAEETLAQAEDRFSAGVASNIEVVQAQQAAAEAAESLISSLFAHNMAKLNLARAIGAAETKAGQYLGGGE